MAQKQFGIGYIVYNKKVGHGIVKGINGNDIYVNLPLKNNTTSKFSANSLTIISRGVFEIGDIVHHEKYGNGKITGITIDDLSCSVRFENAIIPEKVYLYEIKIVSKERDKLYNQFGIGDIVHCKEYGNGKLMQINANEEVGFARFEDGAHRVSLTELKIVSKERDKLYNQFGIGDIVHCKEYGDGNLMQINANEEVGFARFEDGVHRVSLTELKIVSKERDKLYNQFKLNDIVHHAECGDGKFIKVDEADRRFGFVRFEDDVHRVLLTGLKNYSIQAHNPKQANNSKQANNLKCESQKTLYTIMSNSFYLNSMYYSFNVAFSAAYPKQALQMALKHYGLEGVTIKTATKDTGNVAVSFKSNSKSVANGTASSTSTHYYAVTFAPLHSAHLLECQVYVKASENRKLFSSLPLKYNWSTQSEGLRIFQVEVFSKTSTTLSLRVRIIRSSAYLCNDEFSGQISDGFFENLSVGKIVTLVDKQISLEEVKKFLK